MKINQFVIIIIGVEELYNNCTIYKGQKSIYI